MWVWDLENNRFMSVLRISREKKEKSMSRWEAEAPGCVWKKTISKNIKRNEQKRDVKCFFQGYWWLKMAVLINDVKVVSVSGTATSSLQKGSTFPGLLLFIHAAIAFLHRTLSSIILLCLCWKERVWTHKSCFWASPLNSFTTRWLCGSAWSIVAYQ